MAFKVFAYEGFVARADHEIAWAERGLALVDALQGRAGDAGATDDGADAGAAGLGRRQQPRPEVGLPHLPDAVRGRSSTTVTVFGSCTSRSDR